MKKIAAITSVRNGARFLHRWISYYGAALGPENLFVILDGQDQARPDPGLGVNTLCLPHVPLGRLAGDKQRARRASALARTLFTSYDIVMGTDVDEFVVVDPATGRGLAEYLSELRIKGSVSALGVDVARNSRAETTLDWDQPFLGQRKFGKLSDRYTKAAILSEPLNWGSGQHRVRRHGFQIDPNLYLFHFGSVDDQELEARTQDIERVDAGWGAHQIRRNALSEEISTGKILSGDDCIASARKELGRSRSLVSWNKPRPLRSQSLIEIPERFFGTC